MTVMFTQTMVVLCWPPNPKVEECVGTQQLPNLGAGEVQTCR